jgi:hypothetical protein
LPTIAKLALIINLFLVFNINLTQADLIRLFWEHEGIPATWFEVRIRSPSNIETTAIVIWEKQLKLRLDEPGEHSLTLHAFDEFGRIVDCSNKIYYKVVSDEVPGLSGDDGTENDNDKESKDMVKQSGSCFLSSIISKYDDVSGSSFNQQRLNRIASKQATLGIDLFKIVRYSASQEAGFIKNKSNYLNGGIMVDFDKKSVSRILIEELDYNAVEADLLAEGIGNIHPYLHEALSGYIDQRIEKPFVFKGISIAQIMEKSRCNYINALVTMNAFINDPALIEKYKSIPPEQHRLSCGGFKTDA